MYTLFVKDLATGALLPDQALNTYYGVEWANDNRTIFYSVLDEAKRPYKLFRHTVGTQLAEGGARIQTIMAILGHRSAQMSATYSRVSDPIVKEQYEQIIAAGGRIAGPAAEALIANRSRRCRRRLAQDELPQDRA